MAVKPVLALAEISFADPGAAPVWQDVSGYLRRWSITRGRGTELDQQQAGTGTFVLDNRDGRFDPANTAGPYYPNVKPMRRIRISAQVEPTTAVVPFTMRSSTLRSSGWLRAGTSDVALFSGFVEEWSQTWALSNGDAWVAVKAVDGFKVANLASWTYGYFSSGSTILSNVTSGDVVPATGPPFIPNDLTGARLVIALDAMDWPSDDRDLDAGTVTIWGSDGTTNIPVTTNVLTYLLQVADTEGGLLFISGDGRLRFIDAAHVAGSAPSEIYGGGTGETPYLDIEVPYDDSRLWNDLTVTTTAPTLTSTAHTTDATSIASYFRRELSITLLPTDNTTLVARAASYLARYKDPALRITQLELSTLFNARQVLSHELGDWVQVRKRLGEGSGGGWGGFGWGDPGWTGLIDQAVRIEGITIDSAEGAPNWRVTWTLSGV